MIKSIFSSFRRKTETDTFDRGDWLTIIAGLAVYLAVVLPTIASSSIWFDEAFGAYLIRYGFGDIARYTASDVHPPLYYWALKVWSGAFGYNEFALRTLSVFFGVIAIIFAWLLVRKWFGRRVAATALLLLVITPFFIRYSQEMRMYAMVAAIAFAATYVLTLADKSKKTWQWVVYGVLVGLGMLTHYYAALVWLTHWLWRAIVYRSSGIKGKEFARQYFSRGWILAHVVALLLFAPWIGALFSQIFDVQTNGFWIPPFTPATPINFLTSVIFYLQQDHVVSWGALVFGFFVVGMAALVMLVNTRIIRTDERRNYFLLIALLAAVPPFLLLLASLPPLRPSFVDRYVTTSALAVGLLIGVSIGLARPLLRRRWWWATLVATVAVFGYGLSNVYRLGNYNTDTNRSNNTRQVIQEIRNRTPGASIIADSPWLYYEAAFYSTPESPVYFIDANVQYKYGALLMLKENDLGKIKDLAMFEAAHPIFWYIGRPGPNEEGAPSANLKQIDSFRIDDTVNGTPAYEAIEYQVL